MISILHIYIFYIKYTYYICYLLYYIYTQIYSYFNVSFYKYDIYSYFCFFLNEQLTTLFVAKENPEEWVHDYMCSHKEITGRNTCEHSEKYLGIPKQKKYFFTTAY